MTEAATEAPALAPETPPAVAPNGSEAGTNPPGSERPAWLGDDPHGFWDAESKTVRAENIHKSYSELKSVFGKRINELPAAARKALVDTVPDEVRSAWLADERARLLEDPEFLTPLQEKWKAENAPQVPEAYVVPDDLPLDTEHPAAAGLQEFAKKNGLTQEAFQELAKMGLDLLAPYEVPMTPEQLGEALGPDLAPRAMAVGNRVRTMLGTELGNGLLLTMRRPEHFVALEKLVQASSEKPLPLGGEAPGNETWSAEKLRAAALDPRYIKRDPDYMAEVERQFKKAYPSDVI